MVHGLVPPHASVCCRLCVRPPRCRWNRPCPESLRPRYFLGEACLLPPRRALPLRRSYYELSRQSSLALLSFGLGLVRGVLAGCNQPPLPAGPSRRYLCESFLGCLVPCHGGLTECSCLFLPLCHRPSLNQHEVGFPLRSANTTLRGVVFEAADIPLCCRVGRWRGPGFE